MNAVNKVILHDLDIDYHEKLRGKCDSIIHADGKYAPCQGCFGCWTKHPAECYMKDSLKQAARVIGQADEFVIITENLYGAYSPAVKNVLDRSIGISTPLSTYRGRQMHHTLRYGKHGLLKVIVYGDITDTEKETFTYIAERNAINNGFEKSEVIFAEDFSGLEDLV
ncbi:MAG: NAD(P)H-dependent oxidoreductase [Oscillospiraceae bacterium]|nr:NAD(P)H-dependent oxidoreductase [Oscillospiraceae bacterium]